MSQGIYGYRTTVFWSRCPLIGIFTVGEETYRVVLAVKNTPYTAFYLDRKGRQVRSRGSDEEARESIGQAMSEH